MAIQRLIGFGKKAEFKEILAILRKQKPDRIRVLWNLSCTETIYKCWKKYDQKWSLLIDHYGLLNTMRNIKIVIKLSHDAEF